MKPLVTVVIPAYNYAHTVERAIRSVMEQTVNNLECFVVDDGSTDNTKEVVQKLIEKDSRFRYIYQENSGVAIARNNGVFSGSAPFVCCLDADDMIKPQFLEACVTVLLENPSIGIAYTGLWFIKPDGSEGLSPWPDHYDYDKFLGGLNQIPTCNVARREVWERLGGQRQRYAPGGAGEEDAEMWLRAGAYGWDARKVTDAGLFVYSWLSGRVSGSKEHKVTNYMAWHPWVKDKKHPFASVASVQRSSHAVRQYDEPQISVVIPVGINHIDDVGNALDSLDAQTFRNWEAIVIDDTGDFPSIKLSNKMQNVYPHVRYGVSRKRGAGSARNTGASMARAPLLLFLDADDWLYPTALDSMLQAFYQEKQIVYTDYVGKAFIDDNLANSLGNRLLWRDPKDGQAVIAYKSLDYDCERAQRQPESTPYIWNLITSLVPKSYHEEIGGFDENMASWEDWDYWIRMAKSGKCFHHLEEQLVVYRFYTGTRRDDGLRESRKLIEYLRNKYEVGGIMACNCKGKRASLRPSIPEMQSSSQSQPRTEVSTMNDSDFVLIIYNHPNRGGHRVIGDQAFRDPIQGLNMVRSQDGFRIDYGYRQSGQRFLVHKADVKYRPNIYVPLKPSPKLVVEGNIQGQPVTPPPPHYSVVESPVVSKPFISAPEEAIDNQDLSKRDDIGSLPGVSKSILRELGIAGVQSYDDILEIGVDGLTEIKGIGKTKAEMIISYITERNK